MRYIPVEVICYELGETFGVLPWRIEQEGYHDVMRYWQLHQIKTTELNKKNAPAGSGAGARQGVSSDQIHAQARQEQR